MKTLFTAIYERFTNESDLYASVNGMYMTQAPDNVEYPYIVFSLVSDLQDFDSSSILEDVLLQFAIYSDDRSPSEACDIFEYLKGNTALDTGYDFYALSVDDYNTLILKRETATLLKVEGIWQYVVTYRCILDYTGEVAQTRFYGDLYALMSI